jgi:hypothetical protein
MEPSGGVSLGPERQYPPLREFTSNTLIISSSDGVDYGYGEYIVSESSYHGGNSGRPPGPGWKSFTTASDDKSWISSGVRYNTSNGVFGLQYSWQSLTPSGISDNNYEGEWIRIKMPVQITLTKYTLTRGSGYARGAPGNYKIYGSNDDVNWYIVVDRSGSNALTNNYSNPSYVNNSYTDILTTVPGSYSSYTFVIQGQVGSQYSNGYTSYYDAVHIDEIYLYGQEGTAPNYTTLHTQNGTDGTSISIIDTLINQYKWGGGGGGGGKNNYNGNGGDGGGGAGGFLNDDNYSNTTSGSGYNTSLDNSGSDINGSGSIGTFGGTSTGGGGGGAFNNIGG